MRTTPQLQATFGSSACRIGAAALALAGMALLAAPASAQDEFAGFRIEAVAGYDNEGVDYDDDVFDGGKRDDDGFILGAGAGYDVQMGQFVFGAEAEFTESTLDREYEEQGTRPPRPPSRSPHRSPRPTTSRAAATSTSAAAPATSSRRRSCSTARSATRGTSWRSRAPAPTTASPFTIDEQLDLGGLRLGAGGEMNFAENFYGKIEYRYSNYNEGDFDVRGANANLDPLFSGSTWCATRSWSARASASDHESSRPRRRQRRCGQRSSGDRGRRYCGWRPCRRDWQEWRDSNPRPSVLETDALPTELHSCGRTAPL